MSNITLLTPATGNDAQAEFLRQAPPLNLFAVLAHSPDIARAVAMLGGKLLFDGALEPRVREIAILRVGHVMGCAYEVAQHERIGREVGLDDRELVAVRDGDVRGFDGKAAVAMEWAAGVAIDGFVSPGTVERAIALFGEALTVELAVTVGYYTMLASILVSFGVPIESSDGPPAFHTSIRPEHLD